VEIRLDSSHLDVIAIGASGLLLLSYYLFLMIRVRGNPDFTIHAINQKARVLWVAEVMNNPGKDILAVQTLRNFIMAASFNGSSAILLILGTLTLSSQAENLAKTWHVLSVSGSQATEWWIIKIIFLLTVLIVAFFSFATVIRLLNHVVFMINLPRADAHGMLSVENIAQRLNRAGVFYRIGMRAFFITVPLAFWLFGPTFLVVSTIGLVFVLYHLDRNPLAGQGLPGAE
jgi:uncharacterized membrane protein